MIDHLKLNFPDTVSEIILDRIAENAALLRTSPGSSLSPVRRYTNKYSFCQRYLVFFLIVSQCSSYLNVASAFFEEILFAIGFSILTREGDK